MSQRPPKADLGEILAFTSVVRGGSFTAAATSLGMPKSTVSRKIAEFEARIGARLLQRTTRRVGLRDAGRAFYEHTARIVVELEWRRSSKGAGSRSRGARGTQEENRFATGVQPAIDSPRFLKIVSTSLAWRPPRTPTSSSADRGRTRCRGRIAACTPPERTGPSVGTPPSSGRTRGTTALPQTFTPCSAWVSALWRGRT